MRAMCWQMKKEHDKAIADATSAIGLEPREAFGYLIRGQASSDKVDYERALEGFHRSDPARPQRCRRILRSGVRAGREEGIPRCDRGLR